MKDHLVIKLRERHPDDDNILDWVGFINDKSALKETVNYEVDRLLRNLGVKFWLTNEYKPAETEWDADEVRYGLDRTYRLIIKDEIELPPDLIEQIKRMASVEEANRLRVGVSDLPAPQQPFAASFSIGTSKPADLISLQYAKALTKGRADVNIAVLDTGVNLDHPELAGKIRKRMDFVDLQGLDTASFIGDFTGYDEMPEDEVGHGTHVCGIVAARGLNMDEGVSPDCSLMAVRVLAAMKSGDRVVGAGIVDNINTGIKWAVDNGANVINMSLGIKHMGGGLPHGDVIRYALGKDVTVVAASGNDGSAERYYPGALPGVFAIGAVDDRGAVTGFTSYGANIYAVAPGLNIYSAFKQGRYAVASGTSQASPFVCGAVGLMKSYALERGKSLSNHDIGFILKTTSDKVDSRLRNEHAGYGLINLADAFKLLTHLLN